mmetsp:Transcript_24439/g.76177  ORF Transcript_24439/g.76177 Transcript_24439/m.76177 type:complete len:257 (-) Transcript_24439:166-936(-)
MASGARVIPATALLGPWPATRARHTAVQARTLQHHALAVDMEADKAALLAAEDADVKALAVAACLIQLEPNLGLGAMEQAVQAFAFPGGRAGHSTALQSATPRAAIAAAESSYASPQQGLLQHSHRAGTNYATGGTSKPRQVHESDEWVPRLAEAALGLPKAQGAPWAAPFERPPAGLSSEGAAGLPLHAHYEARRRPVAHPNVVRYMRKYAPKPLRVMWKPAGVQGMDPSPVYRDGTAAREGRWRRIPSSLMPSP